MIFDFIHDGSPAQRTDRNRLAGVVTVDGDPAARLVVIQDRSTFALLAATWSHPTTGVWEIAGIPEYPERQLLVLSLDHTGDYNAEVADYISQVTA